MKMGAAALTFRTAYGYYGSRFDIGYRDDEHPFTVLVASVVCYVRVGVKYKC